MVRPVTVGSWPGCHKPSTLAITRNILAKKVALGDWSSEWWSFLRHDMVLLCTYPHIGRIILVVFLCIKHGNFEDPPTFVLLGFRQISTSSPFLGLLSYLFHDPVNAWSLIIYADLAVHLIKTDRMKCYLFQFSHHITSFSSLYATKICEASDVLAEHESQCGGLFVFWFPNRFPVRGGCCPVECACERDAGSGSGCKLVCAAQDTVFRGRYLVTTQNKCSIA